MLETQPVIPAARNFGDWGTPRASALSIVVELLNGQLPKVMDELDDGRRVVNQQETLAAQEKAESLQRRFVEWLWSDADRAERLARFYNDRFNAVRPREYQCPKLGTEAMTAPRGTSTVRTCSSMSSGRRRCSRTSAQTTTSNRSAAR